MSSKRYRSPVQLVSRPSSRTNTVTIPAVEWVRVIAATYNSLTLPPASSSKSSASIAKHSAGYGSPQLHTDEASEPANGFVITIYRRAERHVSYYGTWSRAEQCWGLRSKWSVPTRKLFGHDVRGGIVVHYITSAFLSKKPPYQNPTSID